MFVVVELHWLDEVARLTVAMNTVFDRSVPLRDGVLPVGDLVPLQDPRVMFHVRSLHLAVLEEWVKLLVVLRAVWSAAILRPRRMH